MVEGTDRTALPAMAVCRIVAGPGAIVPITFILVASLSALGTLGLLASPVPLLAVAAPFIATTLLRARMLVCHRGLRLKWLLIDRDLGRSLESVSVCAAKGTSIALVTFKSDKETWRIQIKHADFERLLPRLDAPVVHREGSGTLVPDWVAYSLLFVAAVLSVLAVRWLVP